MSFDNRFAAERATKEAAGCRLKWTAIACFAAAPFLCAWTTVATLRAPPPEHVEKAGLFQACASIDTVIVGDSRVEGIVSGPFAAKGWHCFNMGLSGVSPEDMAMELIYAMTHARIRRVVMGVSFEGMTPRHPFEFSRYHRSGPFAARPVMEFATVDEGPRPEKTGGIRQLFRDDVIPLKSANERFRWLVARIDGGALETNLPDGASDYKAIRSKIAAGDYDFVRQRDPNIYFHHVFSDCHCEENSRPAPCATRLYQKIFAALRKEHIACVVFETGRTAAYQAMIDSRPPLAELQRQTREFFRSEAYGGIRFLDSSVTKDVYREEDFFDAVHFVGATTVRLAERLATELAALEPPAAKASASPASPSATSPSLP